MLRFVALLGVVSTALLASCGPSTSVPDAGPDSDAAEHDAGPWPAFAPRLQLSHPEVVCPPTAAVTYTPPARQPRRAGELYFVHPISRDPNALAPWRSVFGGALAPPIEVNLVAMTGIANGGVSIVVHGGRRGETPLYSEAGILVVDGLGDYQTVLPWFGGESFETHVDEGPYPLEAANGWQLHRRMGVLSDGVTDIGFNLLAPAPGVTIAHPEFDEAIARSAPAVFLDRGVVVFVAYDGLLVSACLADGQLRWVLEYDPPRGATPDPHLIGLSDGSVVANLGGAMRVSERGVVMASRDRGYVMGSPSCGVAVQPDTNGARLVEPG